MDLSDKVSAAVLAGGRSSRMGRDKSLVEINGKPLIRRVLDTLGSVFDDVFIVSNDAQKYDFLKTPVFGDAFKGMGPLAGIHSALKNSKNERCFVIACDMPFASPHLVRRVAQLGNGDADAVVPVVNGGIEPLFAVYSKKCINSIEVLLNLECMKATDLLDAVNTEYVSEKVLAESDPSLNSFFNINYLKDLQRAMEANV